MVYYGRRPIDREVVVGVFRGFWGGYIAWWLFLSAF